jgi:hypothetical protein
MDRPNYQRTFVIVWIAVVIGAACLLIATRGRTWRFAYYAKIANLSVCSNSSFPITTKTDAINLCANLEGIGPIPLGILWKLDGEVVARQSGYYQPSHITIQFRAPPGGFKAGMYSALIYEARTDLASIAVSVE